MNDSIIARRYAKAFFEVGNESNQLDIFAADLKGVYDIYRSDKNLRFLLDNPVIIQSKKRKILENVFQNRVHKTVLHFLIVLVDKGREEYFPFVYNAFKILYQKHAKIQQVAITTAQPFDDSTIQKISDLLEEQTGLKSETHTIIDQDLIGGFLLRVGNRQLDASVQGQLALIKKELSS
jgi:F-type H+-transporting ATPase subunit delta